MKINLNGLSFLVDSSDNNNFWSDFENWEKNDFNFFLNKAEEDNIFIDVGAWIGPYTIVAAKMGMKVYAFEPDKVAFEQLKKNIQLNNFKHKPEIYNFGLSKKNAEMYLYSNLNDFGKSESSIINYKNQQKTQKIQIQLKSFLNEINKIKKSNPNLRIKILKIDIEGGEFFFEKDIYDLVLSDKLYCILSYHHMVFNRNKLKKNYFKIRTLFYQLKIDKIYPSKNIFQIANIFRG